MECALQLETCPLCRQDIQTRVRLIAHVSWHTSSPYSSKERHTSPTASSSSSNPLSPNRAARTVPQSCDDTRTVSSGQRRWWWRGGEKKQRRWEEGHQIASWSPPEPSFAYISRFIFFWQLTAEAGTRITNFLQTIHFSDKKSKCEEQKFFLPDYRQNHICKHLCRVTRHPFRYEDLTALSAQRLLLFNPITIMHMFANLKGLGSRRENSL